MSSAPDVEALQLELKQLRQDFAKLAETISEIVRHGGGDTAAKAREAAEDAWQSAKGKAEGLTQTIEEQPIASAAAAFVVGLFVGMFFHSRGR